MKKLNLVFSFELKEMIRKRSFIITSVILCVIGLIVTSIPTIIKTFSRDDETSSQVETTPVLEDLDLGIVVLAENYDQQKLITYMGGASAKQYDTEAALKQAVESSEVSKGAVIESLTSYKYVAMDQSLTDTTASQIESAMRQVAFETTLTQQGIDFNLVNEAMNIQIDSTVDLLGKDSSSGFAFAYICMFVLYMLILFFGQTVSTSVAREKDNRTMELLITSTKPNVLIVGKVLAAGLAGIIQISLVILAIFVGFKINQSSYPAEIVALLAGSVSLDVIGIYLLFSILGYLLYLFIFAALGSLVSKVEDVNASVTPITLVFVAAFFVATMGLTSPTAQLVVVSSYIPLVSLFTMPIRYMLTSVGAIEIIVSSVIMIITTVLIAWLSIYIYRLGSLNYGNKMKFKDIIKGFKK